MLSLSDMKKTFWLSPRRNQTNTKFQFGGGGSKSTYWPSYGPIQYLIPIQGYPFRIFGDSTNGLCPLRPFFGKLYLFVFSHSFMVLWFHGFFTCLILVKYKPQCVRKSAMNFFIRNGPPPPSAPSELLRKFIHFGEQRRP